jgi:DNA-binding transcriptional MerR regulator
MVPGDRMMIGELSRRTGLSVKTIRYYSDEGLVTPSDRTEAGYRIYSDADLVRLDVIRTLRDAGWTSRRSVRFSVRS